MEIHQDPVPLRSDEQGVLRVGDTRVLYALVIHAFDDGATPEEIVRGYDTLCLADVYAVIAYYLRHRDDVQAYLRERDIEAARIRAMIEANQPPREEVRAKLEARRKLWSNAMLKLVTDENFHGAVLRGLVRRYPEIDVVRVQDIGLLHVPDPEILEWAAQDGRILLTHDHETVPGFAYARVAAGLTMPGVFAVNDRCGIGAAIEIIAVLVFCSLEDEWKDRVLFLPLK